MFFFYYLILYFKQMCTCICLPVTPFYLNSKPICGFFHPKNCTLLHIWGGVSFPPFRGPMSSSHTDEILKTRWFFSTSSNLWNWSFQSSIAQGHIQLSSHLYLIHAQRSDFLTVWHVGWDALFSCSNFFKIHEMDTAHISHTMVGAGVRKSFWLS